MNALTRPRWLYAALERAAVFIVLAVLWEKAVDIFNIKPYLLPPLSSVLRSLWHNRIMIVDQALVTGGEIILGYAAAVLGGVLIALAIFAWPIAYRVLYPALVVFQGLPKIALAPLMVVWVGYGTSSKVLMAFMFAFFPVMISTLGGLSGTPEHLVEHFRAIKASPLDHVPTPAASGRAAFDHGWMQNRDATCCDRCHCGRVCRLAAGAWIFDP